MNVSRPTLRTLLLCFASLLSSLAFAQNAPKLKLAAGDHVAYIGNTLADRMQHHGWLETLIHATHPELELTFRNLGFAGDEIAQRPRSANFGSPDEWLRKCEADVVFAFFGYNEALRGEAGIKRFEADLAAMIDGMQAQRYNGSAPPRLVIFSPIAHEDLGNPLLPDGSENNLKLEAYTYAMQEICRAKDVPFVNLFAITKSLYEAHQNPLTMNGIHLLDDGNRVVAAEVMVELFGDPGPATSDADVLHLREAVLEKNYYWFSRYRVVDGYNVYGGRSRLAWHGQSNADVMQREMEIFDVMTANRDKRVWAVARGGDLKVVDDNIPAELPVQTNKPGRLEGGSHPYLSAEDAMEKMTLYPGMEANVFASEEMFPEMVNPVQMAVDPDGRLFASVWPSYPHWNPTKPRTDRIVCLPDEDGDGVADKCTIFADQLNSITGFEFWGGGMLVSAPPEIWFLKDTDGDDRADFKLRMLQGVSSADTHHTANAMVIGPDGGLYWSRGVFHVTNMETPTKTFRSTNTGVYRFDPRTFEIDFHFPIGPNPHGDVFDRWGYQFVNDGTSGTGSYVNIGNGVGNKQWFRKQWRPVAATGILSSRHFPDELQGNFLICNTIGFLGILQHQVKYDGADITCEAMEPVLQSSDPNFRPTDVEIGGDGALYVSDWCNVLIGHMQHNMRDPNRDAAHGRIYRISYPGRDLVKPYKLRGKPIAEVLEAFYAKENAWRYRARLELSGRPTDSVVREIPPWTAKLDIRDPDDAQALLECLWVFEEHRVVNIDLAKLVFEAEEPRVRAAAIRTVGHWGNRVEGWAPLLLAAARDKNPLVRAEAVKAATAFEGLDAAEVIFLVGNQKTDAEIDKLLQYAQGKLNVSKIVTDARVSGQPLSIAAQTFVLRNASVDDLLNMEPTEAVFRAILDRENATGKQLEIAIDALAKLTGQHRRDLLMSQIAERDERGQDAVLGGLGRLLASVPQSELVEISAELQQLAAKGTTRSGRQAAMSVLIVASGGVEDVYRIARHSKEGLREMLSALANVPNDDLRRAAFPLVRSLLSELPENLEQESAGGSIRESGIAVDYFQPNPSDVSLETLSKLKPKASGIHSRIEMNVPVLAQRDAFALRFTGMIQIDRSGEYTFFVASDDGSRLYLGDQLVVNNDGLHGMVEKAGKIRLDAGMHPLTVTYFDNGGGDGLAASYAGPEINKQPIPPAKLFVAGSDTVHDVAIRALASIPGFEEEKFSDLTRLIVQGRNVASSVDAILTLPDTSWADTLTLPVVESLSDYVSEIPARYRTQKSAVRAMELTDKLASRLTPADARRFRATMADLKVNVIRIGTVRERMIYDKERIAVQAGKPVEFILSNTDAMPHNFAITLPGALEEIGELGEATAREKDALARHFIPKSDKILLASRLLQPGETQALSYLAPTTPGVYPYVCTYPGHWRRMFGAMYVVEDLRPYEANPEEYLAAHPLPLKDELLKFTTRNTEWTIEELTPPLEAILAADAPAKPDFVARQFAVGKSLFKAASCSACHKIGDQGNDFGPDLTKLDEKKRTIEHFLTSMLEPSKEIDEKYQAYAFQLFSGNVLTGLVVDESNKEVEIIANPLASTQTVTIDKQDIELKKKLEVSTMPKGLLSKLSREEILDLVAYVYSAGDESHAMFKEPTR